MIDDDVENLVHVEIYNTIIIKMTITAIVIIK